MDIYIHCIFDDTIFMIHIKIIYDHSKHNFISVLVREVLQQKFTDHNMAVEKFSV